MTVSPTLIDVPIDTSGSTGPERRLRRPGQRGGRGRRGHRRLRRGAREPGRRARRRRRPAVGRRARRRADALPPRARAGRARRGLGRPRRRALTAAAAVGRIRGRLCRSRTCLFNASKTPRRGRVPHPIKGRGRTHRPLLSDDTGRPPRALCQLCNRTVPIDERYLPKRHAPPNATPRPVTPVEAD